jgi:hypothetical protein
MSSSSWSILSLCDALVMVIMMEHGCERKVQGDKWEGKGERKGYWGVRRIKVHLRIYIRRQQNENPPNTVWKGKRRRGKGQSEHAQSTLFSCMELHNETPSYY